MSPVKGFTPKSCRITYIYFQIMGNRNKNLINLYTQPITHHTQPQKLF
jgi:hypothetical protein